LLLIRSYKYFTTGAWKIKIIKFPLFNMRKKIFSRIEEQDQNIASKASVEETKIYLQLFSNKSAQLPKIKDNVTAAEDLN